MKPKVTVPTKLEYTCHSQYLAIDNFRLLFYYQIMFLSIIRSLQNKTEQIGKAVEKKYFSQKNFLH